ncbi:MAG: hypothetical protein V7784_15155 [Oceanospirillaceae bacterium]
MSKYGKELIEEFAAHSDIGDHFRLHVLKVVIDTEGQITESGAALPVIKVEIDAPSKECLLHYVDENSDGKSVLEGAEEGVSVAQIKAMMTNALKGYEFCAAQEREGDGVILRYDTPLIGFGESIEQNCFFIICQV